MMIPAVPSIKPIAADRLSTEFYAKNLADCLVVTQDGRLVLQTRPDFAHPPAQLVSLFGGHVEEGETPIQGVVRELHEELGAKILLPNLIPLGAVTEAWTDHRDAVHLYFWRDQHGTMTGCYEWEPIFFADVEQALAHPELMDYARWAILRARELGVV